MQDLQRIPKEFPVKEARESTDSSLRPQVLHFLFL